MPPSFRTTTGRSGRSRRCCRSPHLLQRRPDANRQPPPKEAGDDHQHLKIPKAEDRARVDDLHTWSVIRPGERRRDEPLLLHSDRNPARSEISRQPLQGDTRVTQELGDAHRQRFARFSGAVRLTCHCHFGSSFFEAIDAAFACQSPSAAAYGRVDRFDGARSAGHQQSPATDPRCVLLQMIMNYTDRGIAGIVRRPSTWMARARAEA